MDSREEQLKRCLRQSVQLLLSRVNDRLHQSENIGYLIIHLDRVLYDQLCENDESKRSADESNRQDDESNSGNDESTS